MAKYSSGSCWNRASLSRQLCCLRSEPESWCPQALHGPLRPGARKRRFRIPSRLSITPLLWSHLRLRSYLSSQARNRLCFWSRRSEPRPEANGIRVSRTALSDADCQSSCPLPHVASQNSGIFKGLDGHGIRNWDDWSVRQRSGHRQSSSSWRVSGTIARGRDSPSRWNALVCQGETSMALGSYHQQHSSLSHWQPEKRRTCS